MLSLLPIVIGMLIWGTIAIYRSFVQRSESRYWIHTYFICLILGTGLGLYFGFFFSYFPHPTVNINSFPVPSVFLVLEKYDDGTTAWVDFVTPAPFLFAVSNVPIFIFVAVVPLWLLNTIKRMFGKKARPEN